MATVADTPIILNGDIKVIFHWLHRRLSWHPGMEPPAWSNGAIYAKPQPDPPAPDRNGYVLRLHGVYAWKRNAKGDLSGKEESLGAVVVLRVYPIDAHDGPLLAT
jgi:hypothetical protein